MLKKIANVLTTPIACLALAWTATAPVAAQWDPYPMKNVPRTADGKVDLNAPPRRTPDGKPDLSGFWMPSDVVRHLLNLAVDMKPEEIPLQPWAADVTKRRAADDSRDDPHVRCLPDTVPRMWTLPHLTKAVHNPKLLVLLYEVNAMYRQIFIDGRPFPEDPTPAWNGYSVGHWDGDALVVETRGFRDDLWIDTWGSPMSSAGKMTEKLRRPNFGTLEIELTIDDPKNYTRPFTVNLTQTLEADTELVDEFCLEGEKDYDRLQRSRGK